MASLRQQTEASEGVESGIEIRGENGRILSQQIRAGAGAIEQRDQAEFQIFRRVDDNVAEIGERLALSGL